MNVDKKMKQHKFITKHNKEGLQVQIQAPRYFNLIVSTPFWDVNHYLEAEFPNFWYFFVLLNRNTALLNNIEHQLSLYHPLHILLQLLIIIEERFVHVWMYNSSSLIFHSCVVSHYISVLQFIY